jgi:NADH dehydrogenase (ubiquinone) Fe-S protein 6
MTIQPSLSRVTTPRISCSGESDTPGDALGHPRVWLQIDPDIGAVECGYCDKRFVLIGSAADMNTAA